jgi:hypothetical protein
MSLDLNDQNRYQVTPIALHPVTPVHPVHSVFEGFDLDLLRYGKDSSRMRLKVCPPDVDKNT